MSLAAETRDAVRARPFLLEALRAGVVNYAAAARVLDVPGDAEAVAAALRRFAERLPPRETERREARVTMHGRLEPADDGLLVVGDRGFVDGDGAYTGILASGEVDPAALGHALGLLSAHDVTPEAGGVADGSLLVVVERRDGPTALRLVEESLESVPG